ncbi:MAG TPA: hypothetical protein VJ964_14390, partial [Balneolaceae bacterium]|nr:hypothetical protein [Balneolaceae bacterium]
MQHRPKDWILILDFGSQYTQLIARRVREFNIYCEIHPFDVDLEKFSDTPPEGIILSGSPSSVNDEGAPGLNEDIFDWDVPVLGVCYGLQILAHQSIPGSVEKAERREFGRSELIVDDFGDLFQQVP